MFENCGVSRASLLGLGSSLPALSQSEIPCQNPASPCFVLTIVVDIGIVQYISMRLSSLHSLLPPIPASTVPIK